MQSVEPVLENAIKTLQKVVDVRGMGKKWALWSKPILNLIRLELLTKIPLVVFLSTMTQIDARVRTEFTNWASVGRIR